MSKTVEAIKESVDSGEAVRLSQGNYIFALDEKKVYTFYLWESRWYIFHGLNEEEALADFGTINECVKYLRGEDGTHVE